MALLILGLLALSIGRYPVTAETMVRIMAKPFGGSVAGVTAVDRTVVLTVRLPRVLTAMLVGAALATSGAALQGIFRNPLVSPGILGVASGAGLGAALCILILGRNTVLVQGSAFVFGILAMVLAVGGGGQDFRSVREWLLLAGEVTGKTDRLDALFSYLEETETEIAARTADVPREQRPRAMALHVPPLQARAYEWIETADGVNVAVDMPRWIAQIDIEPDHPAFRGLEIEDLTWHFHGALVPPEGATPLLRYGTAQVVAFEYFPPGGGRIFAATLDPILHAGDLVAVGVTGSGDLWEDHFGISPYYLLFDTSGTLVDRRCNPHGAKPDGTAHHHGNPRLIIDLLEESTTWVGRQIGGGSDSRRSIVEERGIRVVQTTADDARQAVQEYLTRSPMAL